MQTSEVIMKTRKIEVRNLKPGHWITNYRASVVKLVMPSVRNGECTIHLGDESVAHRQAGRTVNIAIGA